jgi:hypothetical protein
MTENTAIQVPKHEAPTAERLSKERRGQQEALLAFRRIVGESQVTPGLKPPLHPLGCLSWARGLWPEPATQDAADAR